jgi:hypothetical protein
MRKRLILGSVLLVTAAVVFLLGYAEITLSIREDYLSTIAIIPATLLALTGIAQFVKVVRFKMSL